MPRTIAGYGWRPSLPDHRDIIADTSTLPVKAEVDPRGTYQMPAVYDQGQLGSCTANAVAAAIEYDRRLSGDVHAATPSRLDIYYGERVLEGSVSSDAGAFGRDGFKFAHKTGVIPETDWPYDVAKFADRPPIDLADRYRIGTYAAVRRSILDFKRALSNRQTIAIGFTVYESFEGDVVARTGLMTIPGANERVLGGHEVLVVGYLKSHPHHALVRNSWSSSWGMAGFFLMPWAVLMDKGMSSDFRTIHRPAGA